MSPKRTVFEIFDFKNAVTLKTGLGSFKIIGNITVRYSAYDFLLTFYSSLIMALSRVVSEIFNVEKCRDLEIVVKARSLKAIDSSTIR